jgi:hypothetical protein
MPRQSSANGCLQQIAAKGLSVPQEVMIRLGGSMRNRWRAHARYLSWRECKRTTVGTEVIIGEQRDSIIIIGVKATRLWLWLWSSWANGCLQQIAANRFSIPQDVAAILLQGFVLSILVGF